MMWESALPWLQSISISLAIASIALLLGLLISLLLTKILVDTIHPLPKLGVRTLTYLVKGLPEVIIIFVFYHVLPFIPAYVSGTLALALLFATYGIDVWMDAFNSIPQGQSEAALALNLKPFQLQRHILMPQLLHKALPGLKNLWLILLKDTALVSQLGVTEIMQTIYEMAPQSQNPTQLYAIGACIYIALSYGSELLIHKGHSCLPSSR